MSPSVTQDNEGLCRANLLFTTSRGKGFDGKSYKNRLDGIMSAIQHFPRKENDWTYDYLQPDAVELDAFRSNEHILHSNAAYMIDNNITANDLTPELIKQIKSDYPLVLKVSADDGQSYDSLLNLLTGSRLISPDNAKAIRTFVKNATEITGAPALSTEPE